MMERLAPSNVYFDCMHTVFRCSSQGTRYRPAVEPAIPLDKGNEYSGNEIEIHPDPQHMTATLNAVPAALQ